MLGVKPSYSTGFAQWPGMSEYPQLWQGCVGTWDPSLGQTGNKVIDWSGHGNHGTITNATWAAGKFGPCLNFDGSGDFVNCGHSLSLDITGEITISGWINAKDWSQNESIIGKEGKYSYWLLSSLNRIQFYYGNYSAYSPTDSMLPYDNIWVHIAVTRNDASDFTAFYINGVFAGSAAGTVSMVSNPTDDVYIGIDPRDEIGLDFNGQIGNVMIFNRVLSASEIALLFQLRMRMA